MGYFNSSGNHYDFIVYLKVYFAYTPSTMQNCIDAFEKLVFPCVPQKPYVFAFVPLPGYICISCFCTLPEARMQRSEVFSGIPTSINFTEVFVQLCVFAGVYYKKKT